MSDFKDIFEASKSIKDLDVLLENDEIDEQTYRDSIELIQTSLNENVDNLTRYNIKLQSQLAECEMYKKQVDDHKKKIERKIKRLNDFLVNVMNISNIDKLIGNTSEIKTSSSKYVEVLDMNKIPKDYIVETIKYSVDKNKIKEDIKNGINIDGAILETRKKILFK